MKTNSRIGRPHLSTSPHFVPRPQFSLALRIASTALGMTLSLLATRELRAVVVAKNHPEWVLGGAKGGLLNLGNEDARHWLTEHVDRTLTEQGRKGGLRCR